MPPPTSPSGQGAAVASQRAAVALRGHTVDTLTAAGHLTVLGWEEKTEEDVLRMEFMLGV